jgi:F-type H+-transporting ATPase subunit c
MGIGFAGGRACAGVARNVSSYGPTFRGMLIGMAVTESTAIYGLVVAFLLLFQ